MIELSHLTKHFGDLVAVCDLSLSVPAGEFFAILGPNAAGKTTTIRMLTGLVRPTTGTVRVADYNVQTDPLAARKQLAYVPDFPFLYDKLTPWEFFRFTGQLFRLREADLIESARLRIEQFNLEPYLNLSIESLSHGTRQRVAIVSALMHHPKVMVLDEPMVGLDPQHTRALKDILREESRNGMTVFISTHQLSVAEEMADRIGIMHQAQLIAVGTREELRQLSGRDGALEASFLALTADAKTPRAGDAPLATGKPSSAA